MIDGITRARHPPMVSLLNAIRDSDERIGERLFADFVEKSSLGVHNGRRMWQVVEQRMDMVGVSLQTPPVSDILFPTNPEKDRRNQLALPHTLLVNMFYPFSLSDSIGE